MEAIEKLMQSLKEIWEDKMARTQEIHRERKKALEELGIAVDKGAVGVHTPKKIPHVINRVSLAIRFRVRPTLYYHRTKVVVTRVLRNANI